MTRNRGAKRAIRARMAQTGEKYTEARRALPGSGGDSGSGDSSAVGFPWPDDPLRWFTDQAVNAILLASDEARMLGRAQVEPEHLLLALTRSGNVQSLLARAGITAGAVHAEIVRASGFGAELVLGRLPRSQASEEVLRQAVLAAVARGILGPSTEHVLLGLAAQPRAVELLGALGVGDIVELVDARYRVKRAAADPARVEDRARALALRARMLPRPGPMAPVFERFTVESRRAVGGAIERARLLDDPYVEPAHLLAGVLGAPAGVVAEVCAVNGWRLEPPSAAAAGADARTRRATGTFSTAARRIVAEDVLVVAARFGHRELGTGHLLLAILANPDDEQAAEMIESLAQAAQVAAAVSEALPGEEHS